MNKRNSRLRIAHKNKYNMRSWINIIEAVTKHNEPYGSGNFSLHENPSIEEFMRLLNDAHGIVRALIDHEGNLLCWDADKALHSDVDQIAASNDMMGFIIFDNHIDGQQCDVRSLRKALSMNTTMKTLKVDRLRVTKNR